MGVPTQIIRQIPNEGQYYQNQFNPEYPNLILTKIKDNAKYGPKQKFSKGKIRKEI